MTKHSAHCTASDQIYKLSETHDRHFWVPGTPAQTSVVSFCACVQLSHTFRTNYLFILYTVNNRFFYAESKNLWPSTDLTPGNHSVFLPAGTHTSISAYPHLKIQQNESICPDPRHTAVSFDQSGQLPDGCPPIPCLIACTPAVLLPAPAAWVSLVVPTDTLPHQQTPLSPHFAHPCDSWDPYMNTHLSPQSSLPQDTSPLINKHNSYLSAPVSSSRFLELF